MRVDIPKALGQLEHFPSEKHGRRGSEERQGAEYDVTGLNGGMPVKHLTEETKERRNRRENTKTATVLFGFQLLYMARKSPGAKTKMRNDKGWRTKRKIVKE